MFWDELSGDEQSAIEAVGTRRTFENGAVVFREGDAPSFVFVIMSGRLKLTTAALDGRELLLELRGPGELIGELGVVDSTPRSATATAIDRLQVIVMGSAAFRQLMADRGNIALAVLTMVATRLRESGRRRLEDGTSDTVARLCGRLTELADDAEPAADGSIELRPLTQQDLADWIGVSRDAVVLALRQLRDAGWVSTGRRRITIHDLEALRDAGLI